jgi:hypothetical protein
LIKNIAEYKDQTASNLQNIRELEALHEDIRKSNDLKLKAANAELRKVKDIQSGLKEKLATLKKKIEIVKSKKDKKEKDKEEKNANLQNL